jgi:nucleotide-binding universal stress UspA family protein
MFKNVLLTVDLNAEESWAKALPQAVELVKASKGQLHLITVVPDFGYTLVSGYFPEGFKEKALQEASEKLTALVEAHVPKGVAVESHLAYGALHEQVLIAIDKTKPDLVVMASHKPNRLREFLVGSQADRVVRHSPVSVLVVRA